MAKTIVSTYMAFEADTRLCFHQASAPLGWTKDTTHNNKALRVVSGTGGGSGGAIAFTDTFTNRIVPLVDHYHAVFDPGHAHSFSETDVGQPGYNFIESGGEFGTFASNRVTSGSGTGISIYYASQTPSNPATGNTMDFTVQYVDIIICQKDA